MELLHCSDVEPYCLFPRADGATIRWFSSDPYRGGLLLREITSGREQVVREDEATNAHEIRLSGLSPFTGYDYRVLPDGRTCEFRTASETDVPFRFVVFGDPQNHVHLRETMAVAAELEPDFAIGLGDFVGAARHDTFARFLDYSRPLLDRTPLVPVPGNHDHRRHCRPFSQDNDTELFDLYLGNGQTNNTAFDYGRLRFLQLNYPDSDTVKLDDESGQWLVGQLQEAQRLGKKVVLSHHCPCFTSTTIDWAVEASLVPPLLEEFRDTLLIDFGAHIHTYERSTYPDEHGTCFITAGGAGELYSEFPVNQRTNPYQQAAFERCHVCLVEVGRTALTIRAVDVTGETFDSVELDC